MNTRQEAIIIRIQRSKKMTLLGLKYIIRYKIHLDG